MYLKSRESIDGLIVLIDPYIHKKANLSRKGFLEKVRHVKYLRTRRNSDYITFYITSLTEYNNLIQFHKLVNDGFFDFDYYHVFAIALQPKLYNWFKTTSISTIQKQIACWMASAYFFNPDLREIQKKQVYKPLFEEELAIIARYYSDFKLPDIDKLRQKFLKNYDESLFHAMERCTKKYLDVCNQFYGSQPPAFLSNPFNYEHLDDWGVNGHHNFDFIESYMNDRDWDRIIKGNSEDNMHRAESIDELWLKWKHTYSTFDIRKSFEYSFFLECDTASSTERNSTKRNRRENISSEVKIKVWNRDGGRCVVCGSNEKLEYDHIIPFSKGGANSVRNLQLLCETCNRKKGAKIQ